MLLDIWRLDNVDKFLSVVCFCASELLCDCSRAYVTHVLTLLFRKVSKIFGSVS